MLIKRLKNINTPLIVAVFLVFGGLMSACFLGKAKKASEQAFFNGTIFVSTAEGAGTIPAPANIPITQIENESTQGVVTGINNLDITMRSSRVYSEGLIKDQETPFSPVLSAISAR